MVAKVVMVVTLAPMEVMAIVMVEIMVMAMVTVQMDQMMVEEEMVAAVAAVDLAVAMVVAMAVAMVVVEVLVGLELVLVVGTLGKHLEVAVSEEAMVVVALVEAAVTAVTSVAMVDLKSDRLEVRDIAVAMEVKAVLSEIPRVIWCVLI